jgi:hypothetical protein
MIATLILVSAATWCFAQAIHLHLVGKAGAYRLDDCKGQDREAGRDSGSTEPTFVIPKVISPVPSSSGHEPSMEDLEEASTSDLPREPTEELPLELVVEIHRRELGGGETLAAVVRWDGFRARWCPVTLEPEQVTELQRLVLQRTGVWPGHGRLYVEAVAAALADPEGCSRWRAQRVRGAA